MQFKVLVVGDRLGYQEALKGIESKEDCQVVWSGPDQPSPGMVGKEGPDLVLVDLEVGGRGGLQLLEKLRSLNGRARIVALTTRQSVAEAVQVVKSGADDYLAIPSDLPKLDSIVAQAYGDWQLRKEREGSYKRRERYGWDQIVGKSAAIKRICEVARKVSESEATTVLVRGETGTGKELIARAIHYNSARGDCPFVEVNCTAIPETLLEAELFGHEKGAFTDAKSQKKGLLELADSGSLFLDEVGTISPVIQAKLLKSIEEKIFIRLGGTKEIQVDLRIIAATNRDLEQALRQGSFREDLYYRLNVVSIELPPLRKRGGDVLLLAKHFLRHYNEEFNRDVKGFSPGVGELLRSYRWPGNVRELKNVVERAVLLGVGDMIGPDQIAEHMRARTSRRPTGPRNEGKILIEIPVEELSFHQVEKRLVEQVLRMTGGNKNRAARILAISRPRLVRMIRKHGLSGKGG